MKLYEEKSLSNFEFWSGAKDKAAKLTNKELDAIENILEDMYPDGMSKTQVNDLFWFDFETVLGWIGKTESDFEDEQEEEEEQEEDESDEDNE